MRVGFTGTRLGMSDRQREGLQELLQGLGATVLHHGDCIGADADAHHVAEGLGVPIVIHPPTNGSCRAYCKSPTIRAPYDYLKRNHNIVDESDVLIAAPEGAEVQRSGTWATIRYARKMGKTVHILTR
jgi:hypothetical protein